MNQPAMINSSVSALEDTIKVCQDGASHPGGTIIKTATGECVKRAMKEEG